MDKTKLKNQVNAFTDPGVVFNGGNAVVGFSGHLAAGAINLLALLICYNLRLRAERVKSGGKVMKLPRSLDRALKNPGSALAFNGATLAVSGAVNLTQLDFSTLSLESSAPASVPLTIGISNIFLGVASGFKPGSLSQRLTDGTGQAVLSAGMILASLEAPLVVKAIFLGSGLTGIAGACLNKQSLGPLSPGRINAAGCFASAASNANPIFQAANSFWAFGYVMLDALKCYGGVAEMISASKARFSRKSPPAL